MTDQTPSPGIDPGLPAGTPHVADALLDAMDQLFIARDLVFLIQMTAAYAPDDEQKAISAGCIEALTRLQAGIALIRTSADRVA